MEKRLNKIKTLKIKICIIWLFLAIIFPVIATEFVFGETAPNYERAKKRNPFIPIVTNDGQLINIQEEGENAQLNLEGIIYDKDGQSMAIINGQILRKNDNIGDAKIVEIRKDSVVYSKDGEIFILNAEKGE